MKSLNYSAIVIVYFFLQNTLIFANSSVAVVPFKNKSEISEILTNEIANFKNMEIIGQEVVLKKMSVVKISKEEISDPIKILDLGKILAANFIVFGAYQEVGETIKISTQVIDVENKAVQHIYQLTGSKNDFKNILRRLAFLLFCPENYSKPEKKYSKINIPDILIKKENYSKDNSFLLEINLENVSASELTFKNFIFFKSNFIPFFWLDNNVEVVGTIQEQNGESIVIFNANKGETNNILGTFSPYPIKTISLSPDKKQIAYESHGDIYVLNLDGSNRKKLDFGLNPSWSPDSKKIAYIKGNISKVYFQTIDEIEEPQEIVKGNIAAWFPGGKEIAFDFNYDSSSLSLVEIDTKNIRKLVGDEALDYYFLFASNNYGGIRIPMFVKRNWIIRNNEKKQIEVIDLSNTTREIIKIKGIPYEVDAKNLAWSKDGKKLIYNDLSKKNITIADFGFKERTYLKLNVGITDGLQKNNNVDLVKIDAVDSPKNGSIYRYKENLVGSIQISRIFPKVSIAHVPSYEIKLDIKNNVIKYILSNGAEIEGCITYYDDDIISFLDHEKIIAANLFKTANDLFDKGEFSKANEILKKIIDVYPETPYYKNAKDMLNILPRKRIQDE